MGMSEKTIRIGIKYRKKLQAAWDKPVDLREAIKDTLRCIPPEQSTTVFMSGGLDSHACLFAAMDLGLNPSVVSFTLDTHESTDFKSARFAAEVFGLDFQPVILDSSEAHIKKWVRYATSKLGLKKKSEIECCWPLFMALRQTKATHILMGLESDVYFASAKRPSMHAKDCLHLQRRSAFRQGRLQNDFVKQQAFKLGKYVHLPFIENGRIYVEMQTSLNHKELNTPQKRLLREAFTEEIEKCQVGKHQNFQLGDTNIASNFSDKLLNSSWNKAKHKSVVAIYNRVFSGELV
jgi:asparagine synthetase B (glutamine-hydrolysing)